jgi:hypothetical protein
VLIELVDDGIGQDDAVASGSWGGQRPSLAVERNRFAVKGGESSRLEVKAPVSASVPYL